jgi:hypothetical protein
MRSKRPSASLATTGTEITKRYASMTNGRANVDRGEKLAQRIVELLDEATEELCQRDAFIAEGVALALAVDMIDSRYAAQAFREVVTDCLTARHTRLQ